MEIALQGESKGIFYEGYEKTFIQCIFEEGEVQGRNERYEFRCDSHLECCGRICCTPQDAVIPLWLMIIFIIMALLLLLALLGLIAYLCAKRRQKPKKQEVSSTHAGYSSLNQQKSTGSSRNGDQRSLLVHEQGDYSTPDYGGGYAGRGIDRYGGGTGDRYGYRNNAYGGADGDRYGGSGYGGRGGTGGALVSAPPRRDSRGSISTGGDGSVVRHGVHETFEESYKQEIVYEKAASTSSKELL